jgi:hypothetical protein
MGVHRQGRESPNNRRINQKSTTILIKDYLGIITAAMHKPKKIMLIPMVILKSVFSTPRLAVKTEPVSPPVRPPNPAPLLCMMTLKIKAIDVIINARSKYRSTNASVKY